MSSPRALVQAVGSLWFAAILLMLLLLAMACATVYESQHGAPQALSVFYGSWWFTLLLALLAVNVGAALAVRYPFKQRHFGFAITHLSILTILTGAWVTKMFGINGQVGLTEGQSATQFATDVDALTLTQRDGLAHAGVDLDARALSSSGVSGQPNVRELSLNGVQATVQQYLPDSKQVRRVVNDSTHAHTAAEVSLSMNGVTDSIWVFADRPAKLGGLSVGIREITDRAELDQLLAAAPSRQPASDGRVSVAYQGSDYEFALAEAMKGPMAIGQTGRTLRVLRYLPDARVGQGGGLVSASDQPVNPAIEVEIVGPDGTQTRPAFAKFPEFWAMHKGDDTQAPDMVVRFVAPTGQHEISADIELLAGPEDTLHVRFRASGDSSAAVPVVVGTPIETAWPGVTFAVGQLYDHARVEWTAEPVEPVSDQPTPALLVNVTTADHNSTIWLRKYTSQPITANGVVYDMAYTRKTLPLGFSLKLDHFTIGRYPGTMRPRSFESHVSITDPVVGVTDERIISMNHPLKRGRYRLYQTSYREIRGQTTSYLSVSWDPGQPVVFVGYIALMVGMVWVLITRLQSRRQAPAK